MSAVPFLTRRKRSLPTQDDLEELPFEDLSDHLFSGSLEPETAPGILPESAPANAPRRILSEAAQQQTTGGKLKTMAAPAARSRQGRRPDIYPIRGAAPDVGPYFSLRAQPDTQLERIKANAEPYRLDGSGPSSGTASGDRAGRLHLLERRRRDCKHRISVSRHGTACAGSTGAAVVSALQRICETGEMATNENAVQLSFYRTDAKW